MSHKTVCTVALTYVEKTALTSLLENLPYEEIHLVSPNQEMLEFLQTLTLEGKTLHAHRLAEAYSVKRFFQWSRQIANKRVRELCNLVPNILTLKRSPALDFQGLFTRRMSLTNLIYELCFYIAFQNSSFLYLPQDACIFYSYFFSSQDIVEIPEIASSTEKIKIIPLLYGADITPCRNAWECYRQQFYNHLRGAIRHPKKILSTLLHAVRTTQDVFFHLYTMLAEKNLPRFSLPNKRPHSNKKCILIPLPGLTHANYRIYTNIYGTLLQKLLQAGYSVQFQLPYGGKSQEQLLVSFKGYLTNRLSGDIQQLSFRIQAPNLTSVATLEKLFGVKTIDLLIALSQKSFSEEFLVILKNTMTSFASFKEVLSLYYAMVQTCQIDILMGLEEDIEAMTALSLMLKNERLSFKSYLIPSCLPEYTECFDCIEADHFFIHHRFVQNLFEDQNTNIGKYQIVGATEWEANPPVDEQLPVEVTDLMNRSDFVLGIFHQSIIMTYHQQVIYDGLVVNFPDVYQRFLDQHPNACIIIKPHRSDNMERLKSVLPSSDRIAILPVSTHNELLYPVFDAVLSMHSTTIMHNIAHGVPVIALYQYPDYYHYYDFIKDMGCLVTNSHDEVLDWLSRFKNDPEFKQHVLSKVKAYQAHNQQHPASEAILRKILEDQNPSAVLPIDQTVSVPV